jgi:ribonuclease BN (tRNA processing enzyme)
MELVILGTSAAFARRGENCSSYLLKAGGKNLVMDTGPGSFGYLQNHIHYKDISCILLSHLHADHVSDIYTLRYAVFVAQRDGLMEPPLSIYMPKSPKRTYSFIKDAIKEEFLIEGIADGLEIDMAGIRVRFKRTEHPVPCYAMRFDHDGRSLVYTADTMYFQQLASFAEGASLLLAEATLQDADRGLEAMGHMTAGQAARLARESGVGKLVLTHLWPEYDAGKSLEEAKAVFDEAVVGRTGMVVSL